MDSVQVAESNYLASSTPSNGTPLVPLVENSSTNHLTSPPIASSSSVDVGAGEHQGGEELRNPNTGNNTSSLVHPNAQQQSGHVLQQGNEVAGQFKTPQQPQSQQVSQQPQQTQQQPNGQPSTPDNTSSASQLSMLSPQYQQQLQQVQQQHQQQQNIASVFPQQQKLQQQPQQQVGVGMPPQQMMANSPNTQPFMPSPSSSSGPVNAMNNLANMAAASPPNNNSFAGLTNAVPNNNGGAGAGADTGSPGSNNQQLVRSGNYTDKGAKYIDLTDYLALPQTEAARRLGIPTSTLSKRWKEAVVNRKWPYRMVCKLNKEIMTLLHNVPQGPGAPPLPPEVEQSLGILLRRRQEELRGVVIRI